MYGLPVGQTAAKLLVENTPKAEDRAYRKLPQAVVIMLVSRQLNWAATKQGGVMPGQTGRPSNNNLNLPVDTGTVRVFHPLPYLAFALLRCEVASRPKPLIPVVY